MRNWTSHRFLIQLIDLFAMGFELTTRDVWADFTNVSVRRLKTSARGN